MTGLDPDDGEEYDDADETPGGDPLKQLADRYAQDKDALLARLRGMNDEYLNEKERQAELLRLRRQKLMADKEDNFDNAAMLIGK